MGGCSRLRKPRSRGQSEVIGYVLIVSLVVGSAAAVVLVGATAIEDSRDHLSLQRAEESMAQFDSKAVLTALRNADVQEVDFPTRMGAGIRIREDAAWMNITVTNRSNGNGPIDLANRSIGTVEYRRDGKRVAYEGGGVWRGARNGSSMVSSPEFHFRNGTLTLPMIEVTGGPGEEGTLVVKHDRSTKIYPDPSLPDGRNPLDNHEVVVVVRSDYYQAWGRFFEDRTDGVVEYIHPENKVLLELRSPIGVQRIPNALTATSGLGTLKMTGAGSAPARTDSYDSRVGPYAAGGSKGNITVGGNVDLLGNSRVYGHVRAGGWVSCQGASHIDGSVGYTDAGGTDLQCTPSGGSQRISGVRRKLPAPITAHVNETVDGLASDNENGDVGAIDSSDTLTFTGGSATLDAGEYYLEHLTLHDRTLNLETGGETIRIGVEEYVDIEGNADVNVRGNGRVEVYVRGSATEGDGVHVDVQNQGNAVPEITTDGPVEDGTRFWLYGGEDLQVRIDGSGLGQRPTLHGVVYAPAGPSGSASAYLTGQVFGGVVTGEAHVDTGGEVHYDEALEDQQVLPRDTKVLTITHLLVTANRIEVTGG